MVTSSNIFVNSMQSEGESPSQVPGQNCGLRELVKLATCSNMDSRLLSLGLMSQRIVFEWRMATRNMWISEFWVHISSASAVKLGHWWEHMRHCTREQVPWKDNADTCCDIVNVVPATGHQRHDISKTVAAVFPGVPRVGQSHASHHSSSRMRVNYHNWSATHH